MFSLREMLLSLTTLLSAAFVMLVSPVLRELIHPLIRDYLTAIFFRHRFTYIIEYGTDPRSNQLFEAVTIYLCSKFSSSTRRLKVCQTFSQERLIVDLVKGEEIHESFQNIELKWKLCENGETGQKFFELVFDKRFKETVLDSYLNHVKTCSKEIQEKEKKIKRYTNIRSSDGAEWVPVNAEHPAMFEKLAMDIEEKRWLMDDLKRFAEGKERYMKLGRLWRRGYLLHGPPGTGKTSMIAAMAKHLQYDIYNLNLSDIHSDTELRSMFLSTSNRSIIAIEDIDCSAQLAGRNQMFTQRGLLNLIDGLCSSSGDGRIFVFTAKHRDGLDPALLRPGRVDKLVQMSYCTMDGFRLLASNYLVINGNHQLYSQIEGLLVNSEVTPAEICEELLRDADDPDVALKGVLRFLEQNLRM